MGQKVATVFNGYLNKGEHTFTWNGKYSTGGETSSGVYFSLLKTDRYVLVRKMIKLG
jgi:flagellar hook assembly protein FlgD